MAATVRNRHFEDAEGKGNRVESSPGCRVEIRSELWYNRRTVFVHIFARSDCSSINGVSFIVGLYAEGDLTMALLFKILLIVFSIGLIAIVLLQKGKSAGLTGAISGGAEHLFGKQKARGLDLLLQRLTMVLATGFIVLSLIVAYLVKS